MPRTRPLATLVLLALSATLLSLPGTPLAQAVSLDPGPSVVATTPAATATTAPRKRRTVVLRARAIPLSAPEIPNPMRGEYEWLGSSTVPAGFPVKDVYYRDRSPGAGSSRRRASTTSAGSTRASLEPTSSAAGSGSG